MREKILLENQWKFHLGDIPVPLPLAKGPTYMQAKTEQVKLGPASIYYNDNSDGYSETGEMTAALWQDVMIPHDYIIAQQPKKENNFALGGFQYDNAWYRYHFKLDEKDFNKRISLYFEGIAVYATIYLNGCLLEHNFCGYNSFEVDITDFVSFDRDNVLAVYVDATSHHEGWWYEGGGIYRPVWMIKTEKVSVDLYGVYVHPEKLTDDLWKVPTEVTVRNDDVIERNITVRTRLTSPEGNVAAQLEAEIHLSPKSKQTVCMEAEVVDPLLWDTITPNQYSAVTEILEEGKVIDEVLDRFGFRTLKFDAKEGFFLNGKHVLLKGVCLHQDYGLTGKAVPKRVQKYKLKLMREMGANALRTSHYPNSEATMDYLDEMGFLVMDETRYFSSAPESLKQLEMLIKRDRNRPGVIMWSIGNEEPCVKTEMGLRITQTMKAFVKALDKTRPVTAALCHDISNAPAVEPLEVLAINYNLPEYELVHNKYPDLPLVAGECCATGTTRGWYLPDNPDRGYIQAYDHDTNDQFLGRERTWKFFMERPWIMGAFQWDGVEHRGEAQFPRLCSVSGAIDLYLQKKDAFYQNQSHWTDEPMVHLLPHWNLQGREGEEIKVVAYTNCEEVELFQDGISLGKQVPGKYGHGEWKVIYQPGKLKVNAGRNGIVEALEEIETTNAPVKLKLRLEDEGIKADGKDVAILTCYAVDDQDRVVPDASPYITIEANEFGKILGTGSDICDHVPPASPFRKMRAGLCSVAVQAGKEKGTLRVWARAENLQPARIEIELN